MQATPLTGDALRHDGASLRIFETTFHTIVPTNLFVLEIPVRET